MINPPSLARTGRPGGPTAWVAPTGEVGGWPGSPAGPRTGGLRLAPEGVFTSARGSLGEGGILHAVLQSPTGRLAAYDFLPCHLGPSGQPGPQAEEWRMVRLLECLEGEVRVLAEVGGPGWEVVLDPQGLIACPPEGGSLILQGQIEWALFPDRASAVGTMRKGEHLHLLIRHRPERDPELEAPRPDEAMWAMDTTSDFWLAWAARAPFQGAQRSALMKLAVQASFQSLEQPEPSWGYVGPALAMWGLPEALPLALGRAALAPVDAGLPEVGALAEAWAWGMRVGLLDPEGLHATWPRWRAWAEAAAAAPGALGREARLGLAELARLAEAYLLPGEAATWLERAEALPSPWALRRPEQAEELAQQGEAEEAAWAVRAGLEGGAYLQGRRALDAVLLGLDPVAWAHAPGSLGHLLFLGAKAYLVEPPTPGRVELPAEAWD